MGRRERLLLEQNKLVNLNKRSEFIEVEPLENVPGMPPEKYVVTFTCTGISALNSDQTPQASNFHQVSMYLSKDFPRQEPYLKWLTPIWHPNIEHKEPYHVCTNNVQNWYPGKSLDDLVMVLGEMVQYKRYHAEWKQPWPLDKEAAEWVVNYAEPKGIIGQNKPFDERPLLREKRIRKSGVRPPKSGPLPDAPNGQPANQNSGQLVSTENKPPEKSRIKLGVRKTSERNEPSVTQEKTDFLPAIENNETPLPLFSTEPLKNIESPINQVNNIIAVGPTPEPARTTRLSLGVRTKEVFCTSCGKQLKIRVEEYQPICPHCRSTVILLRFK